jgi:hypothetical protein
VLRLPRQRLRGRDGTHRSAGRLALPRHGGLPTRVRGKIQSAQLAAEFNDAVDEVVDEVGKTLLGFSLIDPRKR